MKESWGAPYNPEIKRSAGWGCLEGDCGWWYFDEALPDRTKRIVGFSSNLPSPSRQEDIVGILIIECPECFSKFWVHVSASYLEQLMKGSPGWWPNQN